MWGGGLGNGEPLALLCREGFLLYGLSAIPRESQKAQFCSIISEIVDAFCPTKSSSAFLSAGALFRDGSAH